MTWSSCCCGKRRRGREKEEVALERCWCMIVKASDRKCVVRLGK